MPGVYTLTYSVTNDDGITATAQRQLYVYQAAAITAPFTIFSGLTNFSYVLETVSGLRNASLPVYTEGVKQVISRLGPKAEQVDPGDVDITGPAYTQHAPQNYSVALNATVYLYLPKDVHRQDILSSASGSSKASAGRHLLASGTLLSAERQQRQPGGAASGASLSSVTSGAGGDISTIDAMLHNLQSSLQVLEEAMGSAGCDPERTSSSTCHVPVLQSGVHRSADPASKGPAGGRHLFSPAQRQLLQSSGPADTLAGLLTSLGAELGTNFTTQPLTTQTVDLLTVSARCHVWLLGHLLRNHRHTDMPLEPFCSLCSSQELYNFILSCCPMCLCRRTCLP